MNSNGNGARRSNSTNQVQYDPFMLGGSRGFCVGPGSYQTRLPVAPTTVSAPQQYMPAARTSSMSSYNQSTSIRDCMQWPTSFSAGNGNRSQGNSPMVTYLKDPRTTGEANRPGVSGDYGYCSAPPKVYLSAPGIEKRQLTGQNIPVQVAPLGTDPMSMIRPMAPLTVRVQAPADLFSGNSSEPRTIQISPAQLYGSGRQ